uniref:RRM domain-containing protein n=1 Tax=Panagrellus redivivus TaxID=6233 RepID=A0A7E4ZRS1_PANRE
MSSGPRGGYRRAQKPIPDEGPYRSFVGNLPNDTIQGDFDSLFSGLQIQSVHMMRDRETDQFKGFAYVEFGSREDLEKALLLDGADFDGHIVRVDVAEDRRGNKGGRGGGPGGHRGGSERGGRGGGFGNRDGGFGGNRDGGFGGNRDGGFGGNRDGGFGGNKFGGGAGGGGGHRNTFGPSGDARKAAPTTDDGFQRVERNAGFGNKRGNAVSSIHTKEGGRTLPKPTVPLTSDPNRPKLNLAPRITDPVELERRRQKDEEDRKARLEKICSVKKN